MENSLNDLTYPQLEQAVIAAGQAKYKAKQLFGWFARGVTEFDEMTDLSKATKEALRQSYSLKTLQIYEKFASKLDETIKYLIQLGDGHLIESVAMTYEHGITVCISTQVGCRMGCRFCASTLGGRVRNLSAGEILGQVALVQKDLGKRVSNVVLMGIGEPLDNYDQVIAFLRNIGDERGMNIGYRHISLSTCGLVDRIDQLAEENLPITLSVSLHGADDATRTSIMPVNQKYSVAQLIKSCKAYIEKTGRRISFEYILIDGVNDSVAHAQRLAALLKGMLCHVNLIPANFVSESGLQKSAPKQVRAFQNTLTKLHINATVRRELGSDIAASCGQLRQKESVLICDSKH